MIHGGVLQCLERGGACYPIPFHDRLRMNLHPDELLRLSQQLRRKYRDARRPVSDLIVLHLGDVHEDLCRSVIELDGLEDRRAVVRHVDISGRHGLKDLVHTLRTQRALDEVAERESTHEGGKSRVLSLLLGCLKMRVSAKKRSKK